MTKSESKYFHTALIMDEALIELLGQKDLQYISVKEICEKAGVNRSTFYLHYETMGDLLRETIEHINDEFQKFFAVDAKQFIGAIDQTPLNELVLVNDGYLLPYLNYVKSHKHIYRATLNNPDGLQSELELNALYKAVLQPILTRFSVPEAEQKYWLAYHINGVMAIVFEWIKNDCKESADDIARVIQNCVLPERYRHEKDE